MVIIYCDEGIQYCHSMPGANGMIKDSSRLILPWLIRNKDVIL